MSDIKPVCVQTNAHLLILTAEQAQCIYDICWHASVGDVETTRRGITNAIGDAMHSSEYDYQFNSITTDIECMLEWKDND